jgi:hypothetical protein
MTTVAIMQPTFLPWVGYFGLIDRVDTFVLLDDVQFSKQSWQSRNRLKGANGEVLISLPISKSADSGPLISSTRIVRGAFERKLINTIRACLGRAPYFDEVLGLMERVLESPLETVGQFNELIIKEVNSLVGIETTVTRSSDLNVPPDSKTERLHKLCTRLGASTYLSPPGSFDYLDQSNTFRAGGVELRYFNYLHPEYAQLFPPFTGYMSGIDALANVGRRAFLPLIRSGCGADQTADDFREMRNETTV